MSDAIVAEKEVEQATLDPQELEGIVNRLLSDPDIAQRVRTEPGFADELIANPSKYDTNLKSAEVKTEEPAVPPAVSDQSAAGEGGAAQEPAAAPAAPQKVTIEVDPTEFGTYMANGRSPAEAWAEMRKGMVEKDKTIEFFKNERVPKIEEQVEAVRAELAAKLEEAEKAKKELQDQIEALKKAPASQAPAPAPAVASQAVAAAEAKVEDIQIPDVSDAFDFLDEESRKKISGAFTGLQKIIESKTKAYDQLVNSQKQVIDGLKTEIESLKPAVTKVTEKAKADEQRSAASARDEAVERELTEIDTMMKSHPEVFGENPRPYKAIEDDFIDFMKNLVVVAGVKDGLYQRGTANFTPGAVEAYNKYFSDVDPSGKELKEKMDARGIRLPEDFDKLQVVHDARGTRSRLREHNADGSVKIIPYEQALTITIARDKDYLSKRIMAAKKEGLEARAQAVANRKSGVATESPASSAGEKVQSAGEMTQQDFGNLITRVSKAFANNTRPSDQDVSVMKSLDQARPDIGLREMFPMIFR